MVLGPDDPTVIAHYTHKSAYRCLVEMDKVLLTWGDMVKVPIAFASQGAHLITYSVAGNKFLNVAAFVRDDGGGGFCTYCEGQQGRDRQCLLWVWP